jgi:hypothetical protein
MPQRSLTLSPLQQRSAKAGLPQQARRLGVRVPLAHLYLGGGGLAVAAPLEDGPATDTGQVQIFPLDDLGAEATYDQNSNGIDGAAAANDHFGEGLGFVAGTAGRSILVGMPDDVEFAAGIVNVIPVTGGTARSWQPGVGGVPSS